MIERNQILTVTGVLMLVISTPAFSNSDDKSESAEQQTRLEAQHEQALTMAKSERLAAEESMEKARAQLASVAEKRSRHTQESAAERAAQNAELAKMHEELRRVRQQLSETSREIARVNRDLSRQRSRAHSANYVYASSDQPVIGLILGDENSVGVEILGVSPDGPSERAGIKQGDVIIAVDGRVLSAVDDASGAKDGLRIVMQDIEANEPVIVSVARGDETLDLNVVPEVREPLTWHSVTRFSSAPVEPGNVVRVERIVVPEIDTELLTEQLETIRLQFERSKIEMTSRIDEISDTDLEFEIHDFSDTGDWALQDASIWFGMPLTRGLRLAKVDASLGEYFNTDRGVLVLKAKENNRLQLQSGDVILQVDDSNVNSPAEFMRALRDFESGEELTVNIKRKRKNKSINVTMPETRTSFFAPHVNRNHRVHSTVSPN